MRSPSVERTPGGTRCRAACRLPPCFSRGRGELPGLAGCFGAEEPGCPSRLTAPRVASCRASASPSWRTNSILLLRATPAPALPHGSTYFVLPTTICLFPLSNSDIKTMHCFDTHQVFTPSVTCLWFKYWFQTGTCLKHVPIKFSV